MDSRLAISYGERTGILHRVLSYFKTPEVAQEEIELKRYCVYCSSKIEKYDYLLTTKETETVQRLCPRHFTIGNPDRKYLDEPQHPLNICDKCAVTFRLFLRFCHFTSGIPFNVDPNFGKCRASMETRWEVSSSHEADEEEMQL
ncbi:Hypothetical predicted protein [Cloeon dipterum]|uniref:Uncharacterized protein n=1 Tax=Cloeon dipterum TaxID=197152 RepID=A0A8S1DT94_9INSE|nr:Hypothetical predicted protein [Cloeon dipterum]